MAKIVFQVIDGEHLRANVEAKNVKDALEMAEQLIWGWRRMEARLKQVDKLDKRVGLT